MAERMTCDGDQVPFTRFGIRAASRRTVHQFRLLGAKGDKEELHGRGRYTFEVDCGYFDSFYPGPLERMRSRYHNQSRCSLVVPDIGPILCRIVSWNESQEAQTNGRQVSIQFDELPEANLLSVEQPPDRSSLRSARDKWAEVVIDLEERGAITPPDDPEFPVIERRIDLFAAITRAVDAVLAVGDTAELYSEWANAKLQYLSSLTRQLDESLEFEDAEDYQTLYVLKEIRAAAIEMEKRPSNAFEVRSHIVSQRSTVMAVSTAIYGNTVRARDLMLLNHLPDPLSIQAGTSVRYIAEAA